MYSLSNFLNGPASKYCLTGPSWTLIPYVTFSMALLRHFIGSFYKHTIKFIVKEKSKLLVGVRIQASQILLCIFKLAE